MKGRQVGRVNQQSKGETPLMSGVLQRAAVRAVADKEVEATEDVESGRLRESRFRHDFSQVGIDRGGLPPIQAKLTIGEPGDKYEQEADRAASQVVQHINASVPVMSSEGQSVQRTEAPEEEEIQAKPENTSLQRMEVVAGGEASTDLDTAINSARGSGQSLDAGLQRTMGQAMGADFSGVKVHTDAQSDQLNQSIQAKAFTTGQDVFFRQGAYDPGSRGGKELIAHELTHVVQQSGEGVQRAHCPLSSYLNHQWQKLPTVRWERNSKQKGPESYTRTVIQIADSEPQRWESTTIPNRSFATRQEAQQAEDELHSRMSAMYPFPREFGAGAQYGSHGYPHLGPIPREEVTRAQERVGLLGSMLHTLSPQNRSFNTLETHRQPTLYFRETGLDRQGMMVNESGRVRQEHKSGPAVYIDQHPRRDLFSEDNRLLDVGDQDDLQDRDINARDLRGAVEGMHHIEIHNNSFQHRSWEVAHASGGGLSQVHEQRRSGRGNLKGQRSRKMA